MAKYEEGQSITVINEQGKQESGFKIFTPKVDRDGLISVEKDGCVVRVNPKRLVTGEPMATATAPKSPVTVTEDPAVSADDLEIADSVETPEGTPEPAPTEGKVIKPKIVKPKAAKPPKAVKPAKTPKVVAQANLAQMATQGELWSRNGVEFDGKTQCSTICLIFAKQGRYLSFNTYNGGFGKKGKLPPIQGVLDGEKLGYPINDLDKLHEKLVKDGYKQFGDKSTTMVDSDNPVVE